MEICIADISTEVDQSEIFSRPNTTDVPALQFNQPIGIMHFYLRPTCILLTAKVTQ